MSLQALLFCSDEKIVRVLRRVLGDLEVDVQHCTDLDSAIRKLTRTRFEGVIVDCAEEESATQLLKSARSAPSNKRAVAVALVDAQTAVRSAFSLGAHFVLYKPISNERAKASFRAVRALMKRERRRNLRVAVEFPIVLEHAGGELRTSTVDVSEGGVAITGTSSLASRGIQRARFTLPGMQSEVNCRVEVAWENGAQIGIRFADVPLEVHAQLKDWVNRHSPEPENDDPPVQCKLTDLSLGGCYLEIASPFPVRTRVVLSMRVGALEVQAEGVVRIMHPEKGMGVEFTQSTSEQRQHVEKFIENLVSSRTLVPELTVEPQGLDPAETPSSNPNDATSPDPLVQLFHDKAQVPAESFLAELRAQRGSHETATASASL